MKVPDKPIQLLVSPLSPRACGLALAAIGISLFGCAQDAPTGDAMRVANTSSKLVANARKNCPGATAAIAEAEAAGAAAQAAADAVAAAGAKLDDSEVAAISATTSADTVNSELDRKRADAKRWRDQFEREDAAYAKANDEVGNLEWQAGLLGIDMTELNKKGYLDRASASAEAVACAAKLVEAKARRESLRAKHKENQAKYEAPAQAAEAEVKVLLTRAVEKEAERDRKKAAVETARNAWRAAVDNANAKTQAARAANSKLAAACPESLDATYPQDARAPGNQPPGLDTFTHTSNQHREPGHSGGGGGGGGGGMGGHMGGHHHNK